jgi:hypothetical protein
MILMAYIAYTSSTHEQYMRMLLTGYIAYTDSIHKQYMRMMLMVYIAYATYRLQSLYKQ